MSDHDFLSSFENCTLPAAEWTHEAHIRMAWLMLKRSPYDVALEKIRRGINRYNDTVLKKENAYHETITVAFTRLIAVGRYNMPDGHLFSEFKSTHPLLLDNKLSALLHHYERTTLFSDEARARFVAPDLGPLPELIEPPHH